MLSLSSIVEVRVNAVTPSSSSSAFSTGLILAPTDAESIPDSDRFRIFSSLEDMLTAGFAATDPACLAAKAYFSADPAPNRVCVGLYLSSESPVDVLQAILSRSADFYGVCLCDPDPARSIALAEAIPFISRRIVFFAGATGSVSDALSANGLLKKAFATGSDRILTLYGPDIYAPAALMGTAMGLAQSFTSGAFALCYQQVPGMLPSDLTETEIASLKAVNANVYITRGVNRLLLENGAVVSGRRFDEIHSLDRIASDLQEAALALLTSTSGKLPQTDETSAVFINRFSAVLASYASAGVLAPGRWRGGPAGSLQPGDVLENGFLLWADSYDSQSDTDRAAHRAMPIHAALCMSGSVETLLIDVDVTM